MQKPRILIAGAGLGGLTAAACLLKKGFDVRVFEQASQLGEIGAGIQQSANSVKVLFDLGLRDQLEKIAVKPLEYEFRRFDTAELLHKIPFAAAHEAAHGAPYYHLHRADFHRILVDKVRSMAPDCITLNTKVAGFSESSDAVTLNFTDGATASGDILIGADGFKSVIRNQIVGPTPIEYTGYVAWRFTVPRARLPANVMGLVGAVWCGPNNHAVMYWISSGSVLNFVGCPPRSEWEEESWTLKRPWGEMKADFSGWHSTMQTIINAADHDQCFRWALNVRQPLSNWSTRRATLLGDAAHPTLPFLAQGAAIAVEDGAVLARALDGSATVPDAIALYQRNRIERTARVVNESNKMGGLYRIVDAEEMRRAFAERNPAKDRAQWLFNYDPLTVPLE